MHPTDPIQTASGAIVMALGIFVAGALHDLPGGDDIVMPIAAAVLVSWAVVAVAVGRSVADFGIAVHLRPVLRGFGIGTWVAATALAARMAMRVAPGYGAIAAGFFILAVLLWLGFIPLAVTGLARLWADRSAKPTGAVLLSTVATEAVALMAVQIFHGPGAASAAAALAAFGALLYPVAAPLVLRPWLRGGDLAEDWNNANCILHGALSILGLALINGGLMGGAGLLALWCADSAIFAIVETVELVRLGLRIRRFGIGQGVLVYDVSQWARNFTFGMFYAFTAGFAARSGLGDHPLLNGVREAVLTIGPATVLALLVVETALYSASRRQPGGRFSPA